MMTDIYAHLGDKRVPIGVIGGSGLYKMDGIDVLETVQVDTPFGPTSAPITIAEIGGRRVAFLPRHGLHHEYVASNVPTARISGRSKNSASSGASRSTPWAPWPKRLCRESILSSRTRPSTRPIRATTRFTTTSRCTSA